MRQTSSDRAGTDVGPFSIVPDWVIRSTVSDRALRLYALIGRYADRAGEAFPSRKALAAVLRTSPDSIDRATKELVDVGALEVMGRVDGAGDRTSNLYRLILAAPGGVAAPVRPPTGTDTATGSRTGAATVAAPMRQGSRTSGTRTTLNEKEQGQEQRGGRAPRSERPVEAVEKFKVLVRIAHDVIDQVEQGGVAIDEAEELVKCKAAKAKLLYSHGRAYRALKSADRNRKRRAR